MKVANVDKIISRGYCSGCGLCEALGRSEGVRMEITSNGFLRPKFIRKPSEQFNQEITQLCPGMLIQHDTRTSEFHDIWGPISYVGTGYAVDSGLRKQGSSGGVISALAVFLLETKKVDFVVHISTGDKNPLANRIQWSSTRDDVFNAAGSRYSPSAPLANLDEVLSSGKRFALVGKPCDIAAIRSLEKVDGRVKDSIPYLISFMCAGIPSLKGTEMILKRLGVDESELKSFRYRGDGWPGMARAVTHDEKVFEMDYATSWGTILNRHLQFRCKLCPDGTGEFADIVCGDAWYGNEGYPDFEERDGRSLIIARTNVGKDLLNQAVKVGVVNIEVLPVSEIAKMQPYQVARKRFLLGRLLGTRLRLGIAPRYKRMGLLSASLGSNWLDWLKNALGAYKRARGEASVSYRD